jgi:hypothetical protein
MEEQGLVRLKAYGPFEPFLTLGCGLSLEKADSQEQVFSTHECQ